MLNDITLQEFAKGNNLWVVCKKLPSDLYVLFLVTGVMFFLKDQESQHLFCVEYHTEQLFFEENIEYTKNAKKTVIRAITPTSVVNIVYRISP